MLKKNMECFNIMYVFLLMFPILISYYFYPISDYEVTEEVFKFFINTILILLFIRKFYVKILIYCVTIACFIIYNILLLHELIYPNIYDSRLDFFIWMLGNLSFIGLTYIFIISLIIERKKYLSLDENERKIQRSWKKVLERVSYPVIFFTLLYLIMIIYDKIAH